MGFRKLQAQNVMNRSEMKEYLVSLFRDTYTSKPRERLYGFDAGFCARKNLFYAHLGTEEGISAIQTFRRQFGHSAENTWIEAFRRNDKLFLSDFKITDVINNLDEDEKGIFIPSTIPLNYSAKIDFMFYDADGNLVIADSKCSGTLPKKLDLNYERQLLFYSAITGIDNAYIIYTTHQNGVYDEELEFELVKLNTSEDKLYEAVYTAYLSRYSIDNNLMPPIPNGFARTTTCRYCKFNSYCWGEDKDSLPYNVENMQIEQEMEANTWTHQATKEFLKDRPFRLTLLKSYQEQLKNLEEFQTIENN